MKAKTRDEIQTRKAQTESAIIQSVYQHIDCFQQDTGMDVISVEIEMVKAPPHSKTKRNACGCKITIEI